MALSDEVISRYSSARLVQLTRHNNQAATTIDTDVLGFAATDVEADFRILAGVIYDGADARHVAVAVSGVVAKLYLRKEGAGDKAQSLHDAYEARMEQLAKVTGRNRIKPRTTSVLEPTVPDPNVTHRPDTDRPTFDDLVLDPPAGHGEG
jgi:hypothetical protein